MTHNFTKGFNATVNFGFMGLSIADGSNLILGHLKLIHADFSKNIRHNSFHLFHRITPGKNDSNKLSA